MKSALGVLRKTERKKGEKRDPGDGKRILKKRKSDMNIEEAHWDGGDAKENIGSSPKHGKKKKAEGRNMEARRAGKRKGKEGRREDDDGEAPDERFAWLGEDPRFRRMPRKETKVAIDSRFSAMFTDKRFAASSAPVDKRGKQKKENKANPFLRYYAPEEETMDLAEEEGEEAGKIGGGDSGEFRGHPKMMDEDSESDADESSSSGDEEDDEDDEYSNSIENLACQLLMGHSENMPLTDRETHRLAVCGLDWDSIKAVDLYMVMISCLPKGGQILSVAVYPTDFGLKCMEIEAVKGPGSLIYNDEQQSDSESDIDDKKLRMYELKKLEYYYAAVVCDSAATADHLYNILDGTEFMRTSNVFDLRFIDDSMEFKHSPRDIATEAPANYKKPDYQTRALQHSNVKLSWEDDEPERSKKLRRKFNSNQLDDLDMYLASTDEDSDDKERSDEKNCDDDVNSDSDDNSEEGGYDESGEAVGLHCVKLKKKARDKYQALLDPEDGSASDESEDKDMEITFNTGLEELSKRVLERKRDKESETWWDGVLRKRKEKKSQKNRSKYTSDDDDDDSCNDDFGRREALDEPDDFFAEDIPSDVVKGASKKSGAKSKRKGKEQSPDMAKEQEASKAELELLFANDQGDKKGYNLKPKKKAKGKRGKNEVVADEDNMPIIDINNDPRFSAFFTDHRFALDPTDPQYKRTAYMWQRSGKAAIRAAEALDGEVAGSSLFNAGVGVPDNEGLRSTATTTTAAMGAAPAITMEKPRTLELCSRIQSLKKNLAAANIKRSYL